MPKHSITERSSINRKASDSPTVLVCAGLIVLGSVVFWQLHVSEFINYDDSQYVVDNRHIKEGFTFESVGWAFTSGYASNWHPVTWLSHILDWRLFGANAGGHHIVNVVLHLINSLLVFLVFKRMTKGFWQSAFVAGVFAIHPGHVESVAFIAERKDVLSGMFWLLTMGAYLLYVEKRSIKWYLAAAASFAVGLMAKPMLVTLPFVLLLMDYWPLDRFATATIKTAAGQPKKISLPVNRRKVLQRVIVEKIPFFVLAAALSVVTFLVQRAGGTVANMNQIAWQSRVANVFLSYTRYIGKLFWPKNLAIFYPFDVSAIQSWQVVTSCALLLGGISIFVIWFGRGRRYLPMGWFWFVGTLVPVIGLVQVGEQSMADRYTYIPYIGLSIMIAWGIGELVSKWPYRKIVLTATAAIVFAAMGVVTYRQVGYWKNSFAIFTHAIEVTKDNYIAYNNLGVAYGSHDRWPEALEAYKQVVRIKPIYGEVYNNLGFSYSKLGQAQEAIESFKQAIRLKPNYAEANYNLGLTYSKLGQASDAIEFFTQAIRIKPDYAEAHNNLGVEYNRNGKFDKAIEHGLKAVQFDPDNANSHYNLGTEYYRAGQIDKAISCWLETVRLNPNYNQAHNNLGALYYEKGKIDLAIKHFQRALEINPKDANARQNFGKVIKEKNKE